MTDITDKVLDEDRSRIATPPSPFDDRSQAPRVRELHGRTPEEVAEWLQAYIARMTGLPLSEVNPSSSFEDFGFDSYQGVVMAYELEGWLGCSLDMSEPFEHPSIERLVRHLTVSATEAPTSSGRSNHD